MNRNHVFSRRDQNDMTVFFLSLTNLKLQRLLFFDHQRINCKRRSNWSLKCRRCLLVLRQRCEDSFWCMEWVIFDLSLTHHKPWHVPLLFWSTSGFTWISTSRVCETTSLVSNCKSLKGCHGDSVLRDIIVRWKRTQSWSSKWFVFLESRRFIRWGSKLTIRSHPLILHFIFLQQTIKRRKRQ